MIQMTDSEREPGMVNPNNVKIRAKRSKQAKMRAKWRISEQTRLIAYSFILVAIVWLLMVKK